MAEVPAAAVPACEMVDMEKVADLQSDFVVYNLDLFTDSTKELEGLQRYYNLCKEASDLLVTTSCFSVWKNGKFRNGCAKVIPAIPVGSVDKGRPTRVFFFDDNINLHLGGSSGSSDAKGICNLRDISKGEYIDFSEGKNGFVRESAKRHTLIHHSPEYCNVMVQVNILDAMSDPQYFVDIIKRYAKEGEKLIVYMDVNGTILWDDSIMGLGPDEVILSAMFGCIEVRPKSAVDFEWEDDRTSESEPRHWCSSTAPGNRKFQLVHLDQQPQLLKQVVHSMSNGDDKLYHSFWQQKRCERLLREVAHFGEVGLRSSSLEGEGGATLSPEGFTDLYRMYMAELTKQEMALGITTSWFKCLSMLRDGGHSVVIQSFGMDTLRVVRNSVKNPREVVNIAVNHELWSDRDKSEFANQFRKYDLQTAKPLWWQNLINFTWCQASHP